MRSEHKKRINATFPLCFWISPQDRSIGELQSGMVGEGSLHIFTHRLTRWKRPSRIKASSIIHNTSHMRYYYHLLFLVRLVSSLGRLVAMTGFNGVDFIACMC